MNKTIEDFLSHVEDLEQYEDLMIESSNEITRSCCFKTNKLYRKIRIKENL